MRKLLFAVCALFLPVPSHGELQRVTGTVRDPSGWPMARVEVKVLVGTGLVRASTGRDGRFVLELPAGEYQVVAEARGFKSFAETVWVNAATRPIDIRLPLQDVSAVAEVTASTKSLSLEQPFGLAVSGDALKALPDDPQALRDYLDLLSGAKGAELTVDGLPAGVLPPRDQIAEVTVERNSLSASGAGPRISIVTREPGLSHWTGNSSFSSLGRAFRARSRGPASDPPRQGRTLSAGYSGPVVKRKLGMGFSLFSQGNGAAINQVRALTPHGPVEGDIRSSSALHNVGLNGHAYLSPAQTLTASFTHFGSRQLNEGAGGIILPERAFNGSSSNWVLQISNRSAVASARLTNEARFRATRALTLATPVTEAVAIDVAGAFYGGGSQNRSSYRSVTHGLIDNIRWAAPARTVLVSLDAVVESIQGQRHFNSHGTFTFASLDEFAAGRPVLFQRTKGEPRVAIRQVGFNPSIQVDQRLTSKSSLRLGSRYTVQTNLRDYGNIGWVGQYSYQAARQTGIFIGGAVSYPRTGFGIEDGEELLRDGGLGLVHTVVANPAYPDPFAFGAIEASRQQGGGLVRTRARGFVSPYSLVLQVGLQTALSGQWRLSAAFNRTRQVHLLRVRNINAPYPGGPLPGGIAPDEADRLRPFYPDVSNILQYESSGNALARGFHTIVQSPSAARWWRTVWHASLQYELAWAYDDAIFANPHAVQVDWAPTGPRHRLTGGVFIQPEGLGSLFLPVSVSSGLPYSVTTGRDDNFDLSFQDRPLGIPRNSFRGPANLNVDLTYISPGIPRLPLRFVAQVSNLLNHSPVTAYGSVISSPYFGQPFGYGPSRMVRLSLRLAP